MTYVEGIQEVRVDLEAVLRKPQEFGLGPQLPQPLAAALKTALGKLGRIVCDMERRPPDGDLEAELSQDADQPSYSAQMDD